MHTFVKSSLSVAVAGLLLASMPVGAAESSKEKTVDPVRACQAGCQGSKDNLAYETCMLQCEKDNKSTNPVMTTAPTKKK